jgi:hypothetical protein
MRKLFTIATLLLAVITGTRAVAEENKPQEGQKIANVYVLLRHPVERIKDPGKIWSVCIEFPEEVTVQEISNHQMQEISDQQMPNKACPVPISIQERSDYCDPGVARILFTYAWNVRDPSKAMTECLAQEAGQSVAEVQESHAVKTPSRSAEAASARPKRIESTSLADSRRHNSSKGSSRHHAKLHRSRHNHTESASVHHHRIYEGEASRTPHPKATNYFGRQHR